MRGWKFSLLAEKDAGRSAVSTFLGILEPDQAIDAVHAITHVNRDRIVAMLENLKRPNESVSFPVAPEAALRIVRVTTR